MCDIIDGFKLCTCKDKVDKSKPHWILERLIKKENIIRDDVLIGILSPYYIDNIETILNELNNGNPFDFEYSPKENDMLKLDFDEDDIFCLIYKKDKWEELPYELESLGKRGKELLLEGSLESNTRKTIND